MIGCTRVETLLSPKEVMLLLNIIRYRFKLIYHLLECLIYVKTYAAVAAYIASVSIYNIAVYNLFFQKPRKRSNNVVNSFIHIHSHICCIHQLCSGMKFRLFPYYSSKVAQKIESGIGRESENLFSIAFSSSLSHSLSHSIHFALYHSCSNAYIQPAANIGYMHYMALSFELIK